MGNLSNGLIPAKIMVNGDILIKKERKYLINI